jgi:hypothetical protein
MFDGVVPKPDIERSTPSHSLVRREINDFLADTGVWISGGVIVALLLWLLITEGWH